MIEIIRSALLVLTFILLLAINAAIRTGNGYIEKIVFCLAIGWIILVWNFLVVLFEGV